MLVLHFLEKKLFLDRNYHDALLRPGKEFIYLLFVIFSGVGW